MARGKIQLKRIENPVHRQITFCKRRSGLMKKAKELSILCDAEIGVFVFSAHGKLYELATNGTMQGLIERYLRYTGGQPEAATVTLQLDPKEEVKMLKQEIDTLQKGLRYMFGEGIGTMNIDELQALEKQLEDWIYHIRSTKMNVMLREIQTLRDKEEMLQAANQCLHDKIVNGGMTNIGAANMFPLTEDEIFQF